MRRPHESVSELTESECLPDSLLTHLLTHSLTVSHVTVPENEGRKEGSWIHCSFLPSFSYRQTDHQTASLTLTLSLTLSLSHSLSQSLTLQAVDESGSTQHTTHTFIHTLHSDDNTTSHNKAAGRPLLLSPTSSLTSLNSRNSLTHSLPHSHLTLPHTPRTFFAHSLTHSLTHSLPHSLTHIFFPLRCSCVVLCCVVVVPALCSVLLLCCVVVALLCCCSLPRSVVDYLLPCLAWLGLAWPGLAWLIG